MWSVQLTYRQRAAHLVANPRQPNHNRLNTSKGAWVRGSRGMRGRWREGKNRGTKLQNHLIRRGEQTKERNEARERRTETEA